MYPKRNVVIVRTCVSGMGSTVDFTCPLPRCPVEIEFGHGRPASVTDPSRGTTHWPWSPFDPATQAYHYHLYLIRYSRIMINLSIIYFGKRLIWFAVNFFCNYCLDQCYYFFVTVLSAVVVWTCISQTISLSFPWGFVSVNMRKMNIDKSKRHRRITVGHITSITFVQRFFRF